MTDSPILQWLIERLVALGPGVLFVVCLLETAVFAGLILPVGALIAFAAMLSSRGVFEPEHIITLALTGALVGDQLGFVVGRWFISSARMPRGDVARIWRRALKGTEGLILSRGSLGVTVSRAIPFVRTVMPWFAGRSGIPWPRFLAFDALGVLLWGAVYIGGGFAAGESWRQVSGRFGELAGAVLVVAALIGFAFFVPRWSRRLLDRRGGDDSPSSNTPSGKSRTTAD